MNRSRKRRKKAKEKPPVNWQQFLAQNPETRVCACGNEVKINGAALQAKCEKCGAPVIEALEVNRQRHIDRDWSCIKRW
jgi:tRNA(Ile2) C34 agmatinyltransferase TiaS